MASDKEQAWLSEYLICLNATEAARRVGYAWPNKVGPEKLKKFESEIKERLAKLAMTADEALFRMTAIARGDLSQYVLSDGTVDIESLKQSGEGYLLKKYKHTRNTTSRKDGSEYESESVDFELYPADAALRDILKVNGKYGPLGTDDDPIQHRVKFIDYGLNTDNDDNPESD